MKVLDRIKGVFKREKKKEKTIEVPSEWVTAPQSTTKQKLVSVEVKKRRKIRVPGLRTAKRVLAGLLLIVNFLISQATLMSAPATQPLFFLFFLNALMYLDYLWKTRKPSYEKELWKKVTKE